jgi:hypothetical protein
MPSTKMTTTIPPSKGVERAFAHMDIQHKHFPVSLFLTREVLMDNVRHSAKEVKFLYQEQPSGDFHVTIRDSGDGNALVDRLIAPAEVSGLGTARYGFGLRMYRLQNAGEDEKFSFSWKKEGDAFFHILEQNTTTAKPMNAVPGSLWDTVDSHGFSMTHTLRREKLYGLDPSMIAPTLREIFCMSTTPETLASIRIRVEVLDKTGAPYCEPLKKATKPKKEDQTPKKEAKKPKKPKVVKKGKVTGIVDSVDEKWTSLLKVLEDNHDGEFPSARQVLSKKAIATAKYYKLKQPPPKTRCLVPFMPTYTRKNAQFALFVQDGFVTDVPITKALGRNDHGSSLNGRYVVISVDRPVETIELQSEKGLTVDQIFAEKERIRQESILIPASSKLSFVEATYTEVLEFLRNQKPPNWAAFAKKDVVSSGTDSESVDTKSDSEVEMIVTVPTIVVPVDDMVAKKIEVMNLVSLLLEKAKMLPTDVFNVSLEALEDWHANGGNVADDEI